MGNLIDSSLRFIEETCDLFIVQFSHTPEGHEYFYLFEQSSLQILRELPFETPIEIKNIFSERERVHKEINKIKSATTVRHFFEIASPLVENGAFPCNDITITISNELELTCKGDGEVHLTSPNCSALFELVNKLFIRQYYSPSLLRSVMKHPGCYHKLNRPDIIISSHKTFEDVLDAL
jgi:hypothetical protein